MKDIPTDEPLNDGTLSSSVKVKWKKTVNQPELTNWFDSTKIEASKQLMIDEAITSAFVMCGIPFRVINNPFFMNVLKILNPGYNIPSREILSGRLLDNEVAKVNDKVNKIIECTSDITIGLDGWTALDGSSI